MSYINTITNTTLSNIATATNEKNGQTGLILTTSLPDKINEIPTAASDVLCIYDGESLDGITSMFNTTLSLDTNCTQGNRSLKLQPITPVGQNASVGGMGLLGLPTSVNLTNYEYFMFDLYVSTSQPNAQFQLNFATVGQDGFNLGKSIEPHNGQWVRSIYQKDALAKVVDTADWANINNIRFTYFNYAQTDVGLYLCIDNIVFFNK